MQHDVLVVGAGIGGLTVAALLAARGVDVCLFERNSTVGGCVSRVKHSGHDFEPGMGLYPQWKHGEIHERIFSELPVKAPETKVLESDYVVRLDGTDVHLRKDANEFEEELRHIFPDCADEAIKFYQLVDRVNHSQDAGSASVFQKVRGLWSKPSQDLSRQQTVLENLKNTSPRFQQFVDAQLRAFIHTPVQRCALGPAATALALPRGTLYSISGGPASVAEQLAEAIKRSGGRLRLDSPVLRLAYDDTGEAIGLDLLSGERVGANRAIISNMTIWDTYGKLVGLNRTPPAIKKSLANYASSGAYVIYASMEQAALRRLPAPQFVARAAEGSESPDITFATAMSHVAPPGKVPVTIKASTTVDDWFAFHSSEEDDEEWDQSALSTVWRRLHQAVPELGADIEVIETANPRTFYEETRRKLGMVLGLEGSPNVDLLTHLRGVYMIGDTVSASPWLSGVSQAALNLANRLTK